MDAFVPRTRVALALLTALGCSSPARVPERPLVAAQEPTRARDAAPPGDLDELVARAWATRDDRLFKSAFEQVARTSNDGFDTDSMQVSANGRSVLLNARRGTALLDASTGEPWVWLSAKGAEGLAFGWFVHGRPDDLVFFRGEGTESGECLVVSVDTGAERLRLPRCRLPGRVDEGQPTAVPPFLVRAGASECDDDELVSIGSQATPIPISAVQRESPLLSYPWGRCRKYDDEKEQPLLGEFRAGTGSSILDVFDSPNGKTRAVRFSGEALTTVGLLGESGRWLAFVRGEFPGLRTPALPTFSPDGRWLAVRSAVRGTYDSESRVLVFDALSGNVRHDFAGPCKSAKSFTWSSDSKLLAVGDEDRSCMYELGKGLLWTRTFVKLDDCFRCEKLPWFVLGDRVVVVEGSMQMPGGAVLDARSGRVIASGNELGAVAASSGELRLIVNFSKEPALIQIDSNLKVRTRAPTPDELEPAGPPENPVATKFRDKLCVRDGYVFPSRFCRA